MAAILNREVLQDDIGRRGGDLIIEVNAADASIQRVLQGQ